MPRSAAATRARVLDAARTRFGADGYERTTIRAVAADAGIDPALVMRHFGSKDGLFAEAADLDLALPDLTGVAPADVPALLVERFVAVWEQDATFMALLRASASSEVAAARMREVFADQVAPALAAVAVDRPVERVALVGSQVLGLAVARHLLRVPALVDMDADALTAWIGPVLVGYLTDAAPV
ncbi:TetR family transcriptional regulator [Solicola sp. PLA-1-18]|uniref:TetR/AcrR family transcriptional regulator n=1 Tax=Solicola sp. PLA-1-18 TaxID=3380532 RepID=UPI003B7BCC06